MKTGFDLGNYLTFELRRGEEDSAPAEKLDFTVFVDSVDGDKMNFKVKFENPTMVSIGSRKDELIGVILDESFFCSDDSPKTIEMGTEIRTVLPKLLPSLDMEVLLD